MTRVTWCVVGVCSLAAAVTAERVLLGQPQLRPGQYEVNDEITIEGKPQKTTESTCISGNGLDNLPKLLLSQIEDNDCTVTNLVTNGDRLTFQMTCPEERVRAAVDMTFGGDSYTSSMRMTMGDAVMTVKSNARRTGACR